MKSQILFSDLFQRQIVFDIGGNCKNMFIDENIETQYIRTVREGKLKNKVE